LLRDSCPQPNTYSQAYASGQLVYRLASVIEVAASLPSTNPSSLAAAVARLKNCLSFWFTNEPTHTTFGFYYDTTFGGVLGQKTCSFTNFGNFMYNDHHFHYGYFIHAAAVVARLDQSSAWSIAMEPYVRALIRDIANPSYDDPKFPFMRYQVRAKLTYTSVLACL